MASTIKKILYVIISISGTFWLLYFLVEPSIPGYIKMDPRLYQEPIQTVTKPAVFEKTVDGFRYKITTMYDYEINAMVISSGPGVDKLNPKDTCVIWGQTNLNPKIYQNLDFKNISYTCYPDVKKGTYWNSGLNDHQLSNNHLIPLNDQMDKKFQKIHRGDQIHIKGYLAQYQVYYGNNQLSEPRISSTTREDYGCEVIYVTDFQIIKMNPNPLRIICFYAPWLFSVSLIVLIFMFIWESYHETKDIDLKVTDELQGNHPQTLGQIKAEIQQKIALRQSQGQSTNPSNPRPEPPITPQAPTA